MSNGVIETASGLIKSAGSEAIDVAGTLTSTLVKLGGATDQEIKTLGTFAGILKGDVNNALKMMVGALEDNIKSYQSLSKEITQLGRGEGTKAFIEQTRLQAFEVSKLGISMSSLIKANKELLESYNGAIIITDNQTKKFEQNRNEMAKLISFNEKFKIDQQSTIGILNLFNNTMGGGTKAAQQFSDSLVMFSEKAGIPAKNVFIDFNTAMDRFSVLTAEKAVGSFEKLEMVARRTGVSIEKVLNTVQKFDDIEEGFKTGGQLNRVLSFMGGSFDTFTAMQADDETRAKMIFESISGVADRFQALQSDQAKRSFAKQLVESTGVDMKTVVGLLNKSTDLAADVKSISEKPIVAGEFTQAGREEAAMRVTTAEELGEVRKNLLAYNSLTVRLSEMQMKGARGLTEFATDVSKDLDSKVLTPISKFTLEGTKQAVSGIGKVVTDGIDSFKRITAKYELKAAEVDSVLKGHTQDIVSFGNAVDRLGKTKFELEVKGTIPGVVTIPEIKHPPAINAGKGG